MVIPLFIFSSFICETFLDFLPNIKPVSSTVSLMDAIARALAAWTLLETTSFCIILLFNLVVSGDASDDNGGAISNTGFIIGENAILVIDAGPSYLYASNVIDILSKKI